MTPDRLGTESPEAQRVVSTYDYSSTRTPLTNTERAPFIAWPGWAQMKYATGLTLLVGAWFALAFVGSDLVTAHRAARVRIHLDAELSLPLVPGALVAYMSLYLLFLAMPFVLRTRRDAASLAMKQSITILVAAIGFLLIPGTLAYAPPTNLGMWTPLFNVADRLNLDYNLVPSLHVAMSVVCIETYATHAGRAGQSALRAWGLLIAASTLLTHQHHLLDVVTGYALALVVAASRPLR